MGTRLLLATVAVVALGLTQAPARAQDLKWQFEECQRRSKTRPCGGAKVGHFGSVRSLSP